MKKLQGKELYRRLQQSRNAQNLLMRMSQKMDAMEKKIEVLEESVKQKDAMILSQKRIIEKQALRIEYLEKIVFGKSKKKERNDDDSSTPHNPAGGKLILRDSKTYQREIPKSEEITDTKEYSLNCCPDCQSSLTEQRIVERYVEDIVPQLKSVEKQLIGSGFCPNCGVRKNALQINGSKAVLGEKAKIMVVYFSVVMRLSYEQIKNMMRDIYHIQISDGEVQRILSEQSNRLTAEHERIAQELFREASHYDETTWKTPQGIGNYAWIKTGADSTNTLFLFGKSRGKGNAQTLCGGSAAVGITDDYCGYDGVFQKQALCWAHPNRKLRDLAESEALTTEALANCKTTYEEFRKMYRELSIATSNEREKKKHKEHYWNEFSRVATEQYGDPEKLKTYKTTLRKEQHKYFTFLDVEGIPMDNNQAERRLRHIVLKRKISLGSKTDKGATVLEKLYSVVLTWWWRDPANFISNYTHLLA